MRVLDIGCGPGTITFDVARYVYPGSVIGVDPNPDRIEQAIDWTSEERKNANLEFNVNDCHDLPFQDCEFDIVYSHTVTQFLLDPVLALREQYRVVKPGGWVIASGVRDPILHTRYPECPNWRAAWDALSKYYEDVYQRYQQSNCTPKEFMEEQRNQKHSYLAYFDMSSARKCSSRFHEVGLKIVDVKVKADKVQYCGVPGPGRGTVDMLPLTTSSDAKYGENDVQQTFDAIYGELAKSGDITEEILRRAEAEATMWYQDTSAFHYWVIAFVAGQKP